MNVLAWILGVGLAGIFILAGAAKILDYDRQRDRFGYGIGQYRLIGLAEVAAAAGVLAGLIWRSLEFLAIAAGVGICILMLGALLAHARVGDDAKATVPAGILFVLAVLFVVFVASR